MLPTEPDPSQTCPFCGEDLVAGEDFCRACGHSTGFADADAREGEPDSNAGDICPSCGATHLIYTSAGFPQCESCGYTERY